MQFNRLPLHSLRGYPAPPAPAPPRPTAPHPARPGSSLRFDRPAMLRLHQRCTANNSAILLPAAGEERRVVIDKDDGIRLGTTPAQLAQLKPVFKKGGSTTAGNSSQVGVGGRALGAVGWGKVLAFLKVLALE